jgi:hypothetical protein
VLLDFYSPGLAGKTRLEFSAPIPELEDMECVWIPNLLNCSLNPPGDISKAEREKIFPVERGGGSLI